MCSKLPGRSLSAVCRHTERHAHGEATERLSDLLGRVECRMKSHWDKPAVAPGGKAKNGLVTDLRILDAVIF